MKMKIYVINLDSAKDRMAFQQKQIDELGLAVERFRAVPANELPANFIAKAYHNWFWKRLPALWEISLLYNHLEIYKKIIESNAPALILEDDAILTADTKGALEAIEGLNLKNIDYICAEASSARRLVSEKKQSIGYKNHHLIKVYVNDSASAGYILYPSGAKKLLKFAKRNVAVADKFINAPANGLKQYVLVPCPIVQNLDFRTLWEEPWEEWMPKRNRAKHLISHYAKRMKMIFVKTCLLAKYKVYDIDK